MLSMLNPWLPVACLVLVVASFVVSWRLYRKINAIFSRSHAELERLEKQLAMMTSGSIGMGQRMIVLEKKFAQLQQQQPEIKADDNPFSYTQALQMFDRGVDAAAVAASCGISRSEAQLMELIRKQVKSPVLMAK